MPERRERLPPSVLRTIPAESVKLFRGVAPLTNKK